MGWGKGRAVDDCDAGGGGMGLGEVVGCAGAEDAGSHYED